MKAHRPKIILLLLLILVGSGFTYYYFTNEGITEYILYGNVDHKMLELSFLESGRVKEIYVQEGDTVVENQVLAKLDTARYEDNIAILEAKVAQAKANLDKLQNGARPEEVAQARAMVDSAEAQATFAESQAKRVEGLYKSNGASKSDYELAMQQQQVANAQLELNKKNLEIVLAGARDEDIALAKAMYNESQLALAYLNTQLEDATLKSPTNSVINRRLLEVGDIASPQKAAFTLAILSPKWVRAYISEEELGFIKQGMKAQVYSDSFPNDPIEGTVGFISSTSEFTPKSVETADLRTALVFEIRIYLEDPQNRLRLGMPVSIYFDSLNQ